MFGTLETAHPRILQFYRDHPQVQFETVNLFVVDLLDKLLVPVSPAAFAVQQFESFKRDYLAEVHSIVQSHTHDAMAQMLETNNALLIEKTSTALMQMLPPPPVENTIHDTQEVEYIQTMMRQFHQSIVEDTRALTADTRSIHEFIDSFETKSNQMLQHLQQPICSYISSSEERIHLNLASLKDLSLQNQHIQEKFIKDFYEYIQRKSGPGEEGGRGTAAAAGGGAPASNHHHLSQMNLILNRLYSTSEVGKIPRMTTLPFYSYTPNLHLLKRPNCAHILVESFDVDTNVPDEDLQGITQMMEANGHHAIVLSQTSGFSGKPNYFIEIHHGYLLVYVHQVEYNPDKIRIAIEVVDTLSSRMKQYGMIGGRGDAHREDECSIDKILLEEINKEYQMFLSQKETMIQHLREGHRKLISQIEDFQFPALGKYLATQFTSSTVKHGHMCDLCKNFNANNLKALAAHKRGCMRKRGLDAGALLRSASPGGMDAETPRLM